MKQDLVKMIDYVEIYAFNAFQAANFYSAAFGFDIVSYAGPETGLENQLSYLLRQGSINLLISSAINRNSPIINHIINHDESIKDIAFITPNAAKAYEMAVRNGAISIIKPTEVYDNNVKIIKATVAAFGNTVHSFIEREDSPFLNLPFHKNLNYPQNKKTAGLKAIDHIAIAMETGSLEKWKKYYENILGFYVFYAEDIYTNDNGMKSVVVSNPSGTIKFVLVEGISGKKKSQIETYISYYGCSGVQHLALSSQNIIETANFLKNQGVSFLEIPKTYYRNISQNLKNILQDKIDAIRHLNILVDLEKHGYLMQAFTRPLQNRPTFFAEIIQRENSSGFGSNNIKALYEAVEQDQRKAMVNV